MHINTIRKPQIIERLEREFGYWTKNLGSIFAFRIASNWENFFRVSSLMANDCRLKPDKIISSSASTEFADRLLPDFIFCGKYLVKDFLTGEVLASGVFLQENAGETTPLLDLRDGVYLLVQGGV